MDEQTKNSGFSLLKNKPFLRWYQQPGFVFLLILILALVTVFLMPAKVNLKETLPASGKVMVAGVIILCLGLGFCVMSNVETPEIWKDILAFAIILYFFWLAYMYLGVDWDLLRRQFFNFEKMEKYWGVIFRALGVTLIIGFATMALVPIIGFIFGMLRSLGNPVFDFFVSAYVTVIRSIPDTVLIVLVYFALPYIGIQLESVPAVIVALTLLYSAYATEIFRSGISAIGKTQREASAALGMSRWQTMMLVVMPQAIKVILPPLTSLLVSILKSTSIASIAAAPEMMTRANLLIGQTASVTPLIGVSIIYFFLICPFVLLSARLEKSAKKYKK